MADIQKMPTSGAFLARYHNENNALIADTYRWWEGKLQKFTLVSHRAEWQDVSDGSVHELKSNPEVKYLELN